MNLRRVFLCSVPNLARFVAREAYSHEVSSCGLWPGAGLDAAAFYAYAYPEPRTSEIILSSRAKRTIMNTLREYILPYDAVRTANMPDDALLAFAQSTYRCGSRYGQLGSGNAGTATPTKLACEHSWYR